MAEGRLSVRVARRTAAAACAIACGLVFAAPAMGLGEPRLVRDIAPGVADSFIDYPASFDGRLFFSANDGANGAELWSSDGTEAGTSVFKDIVPGSGSSSPIGMADAFGELVFRATHPDSGAEPWASDGTSAGTALVTDVKPGPDGSGPFGLALGDSRAYFQADDGTGTELWSYGGFPADVTRVKDLNPVLGNPGAQGTMLAIGDTVYFGGDDNTGLKLWKSDGTEVGTERVSDELFVSVSGLIGVGGKLLFAGDDGDNGRELWVSDGTPQGTSMLRDIRVGPLSSHPADAVEVDGTVFFVADDGTGDTLWKTDGTPGGTQLVTNDVRPGTGTLTVVDDVVYFAGLDGASGRELWKSDGTEGGTEMVVDIFDGADSSLSVPDRLTAIGDRLFFSADDGTNGAELWTSDGTAAGTERVADIVDGPGSSSPSDITEVAGNVFFVAQTVARGRELWSFELDVSPVAVGDSATVAEDAGATAVDVLGNDADADDGPISIVSVTQPANGEVAIAGGGSGVTYKPDPHYCNAGGGTDDFAYELAPGGDVALVKVTVTCADDAPEAVDDSTTVAEDAAATAIPVLANDTDVDGGAPKSVASVTQPANGEVAVAGGGAGLTYRPDPGYCNENGPTDNFTYALSPGGDRATVAVRVTCAASAGTAVAGRSATVKRGVVRLRLRCRGEGACEGRATLAVKARRGKRTVRVVIGAKRFTIAAGRTQTLRIRLSRAGRSRLARSKSGRLRVKLAGRGVRARTVVLVARPSGKRLRR